MSEKSLTMIGGIDVSRTTLVDLGATGNSEGDREDVCMDDWSSTDMPGDGIDKGRGDDAG